MYENEIALPREQSPEMSFSEVLRKKGQGCGREEQAPWVRKRG
jgi:hypothetical protein